MAKSRAQGPVPNRGTMSPWASAWDQAMRYLAIAMLCYVVYLFDYGGVVFLFCRRSGHYILSIRSILRSGLSHLQSSFGLGQLSFESQ